MLHQFSGATQAIKMIQQTSSKINQVPKRRPRVVVYLKTETAPTAEDFANLHDGDVALMERRWGRPIFANEATLVSSQVMLTWTEEKSIRLKKEREMPWEPGQEPTMKPDQEMDEFLSKPLYEQTQQVVLKFRDVIRQAWSGYSAALQIVQALAQVSAHIVAAENGQIELIVDDLLGTACILFLRDFAAGRLGKCANPQCPSPFFVRSRRTQKFCDVPACMVYSHRNSANNYWGRLRAKERAKSRAKSKKRMRKQ
jgi:hypothetical protein